MTPFIWILALVIVFLGFIIGGLSDNRHYFDLGTFFIQGFIGMLLGALVSFLVVILIFLFSEPRNYPNICESKDYEIVQAGNSSKIEGSFYFYRGYIDEQDVYQYYYRDGNKIYKNYLYSNSRLTSIVETDDETPHVHLYIKRECDKWGWWRQHVLKEENYRYQVMGHHGTLYIPKGTIIPDKFDGLNL